MMRTDDLRREGKFKIADWVDKAQKAWEEHATQKNLKRWPEAIDYVNYNGKLVNQRLDHRYSVTYTASGTHIAAALIDTHKLPDFRIGSTRISPRGFVPDVTTFCYSTNNIHEARYLTAILNSNTLDERIKQDQPKGKFGPRHIHRRPFQFPIPRFDSNNKLHNRIVTLEEKAEEQASKSKKVSRLRLKSVIPEMEEIDKLVVELLDGSDQPLDKS